MEEVLCSMKNLHDHYKKNLRGGDVWLEFLGFFFRYILCGISPLMLEVFMSLEVQPS